MAPQIYLDVLSISISRPMGDPNAERRRPADCGAAPPRSTRSAWSPPPACSTGTTRRSTSCGGSCRRQGARSSTSGTTARCRRSSTPRSRRTSRASRCRRTRAGTSSTSSTSSSRSRERGADHVQVVGGGGGVIVPDEIERLRASGVTIFSPEDGQRLGLAGMINTRRRRLRLRPLGRQRRPTADAVHRRRPVRRRARDHRRRAGQAARRTLLGQLRAAAAARTRPGARHHRHRRLRQVVAHRRAGAPAPRRPAGQAARSRWSRSTRPGARAAARCSATGSG